MAEEEEKRVCPKCGPVGAEEWYACGICPLDPRWIDFPIYSDPIASPPHYRSHPSGVEALTITEHHSFCLGNTIKYLWRAGQKEGEDLHKDLAKSWFYLTRECLRLGVELPDLEAITQIDGLPRKA